MTGWALICIALFFIEDIHFAIHKKEFSDKFKSGIVPILFFSFAMLFMLTINSMRN
jgi:hypothetical protein